jgi:hypothetical protein
VLADLCTIKLLCQVAHVARRKCLFCHAKFHTPHRLDWDRDRLRSISKARGTFSAHMRWAAAQPQTLDIIFWPAFPLDSTPMGDIGFDSSEPKLSKTNQTFALNRLPTAWSNATNDSWKIIIADCDRLTRLRRVANCSEFAMYTAVNRARRRRRKHEAAIVRRARGHVCL